LELDPLGPPDEDLPVPSGPVKVRTEAEVAAVSGTGWPLPPLEAVPQTQREPLLHAPANEPPPTELLDIDFDTGDFEPAVTAQENELPAERPERYDAVDPDSLGTEWLFRATETSSGMTSESLDDIAEIPTEPNPLMSEASFRAAEFGAEEAAPTLPGLRMETGVGIGEREESADALDASELDDGLSDDEDEATRLMGDAADEVDDEEDDDDDDVDIEPPSAHRHTSKRS
jgi:hypothetical protein